ncbi:MAG: TRAM domain-containing protein, partial [Victivallales bacterium]|nr:TRAM domain-containing protein [Victivallales bacterium]
KRSAGKMKSFHVVIFDPSSDTERGQLVKVKITHSTSATLFGELV